MRTLVISDLHLGIGTGTDVLRRPAALDALVSRLEGVERLVLLGDTLELRGGPARDAIAVAEPVMRAIGGALGPDGQVLIAAGNHDHALVAGWLDWRGRREAPEPLGVEQRLAPHHASWIAKRLADLLAPATVEVVYPGVWLRDDVYAIHGNYLDAHSELPTLERLAVGAMGLMVGALPDPASPEDYESRLAPIYAWIHATGQRAASNRRTPGAGVTVKVWRALEGRNPGRVLRRYALAAPFRLGVVAANAAGLGPLRADIGGPALRRAGLRAIAETMRRLRLAPEHVVFGHTHRAGPLPGDDEAEWRTPDGTRLHNVGSWVFEEHFIGPGPTGTAPYWPGGAVVVDDDGPPRLERLLDELPAGALLDSQPAA